MNLKQILKLSRKLNISFSKVIYKGNENLVLLQMKSDDLMWNTCWKELKEHTKWAKV